MGPVVYLYDRSVIIFLLGSLVIILALVGVIYV